jgi:hypothetical protein
MAREDALDARLRERWAKRGGGPELERRLKAAEAELARRANVRVAERRGVKVPDSKRVPVTDPTAGARPFDSRPVPSADGIETSGSASNRTTPISVEDALRDALAVTKSQTKRAVANADPRSFRGQRHGAGDGDSSDDDETAALEAGCVVVQSSGTIRNAPVTPDIALADSKDKLVLLKNQGNEALRDGDLPLAAALYDQTVSQVEELLKEKGRNETNASNDSSECVETYANLLAVTLSNRAHCTLSLDDDDDDSARRCTDALQSAVDDCERAIGLRPDWHKPFARLATAHARLGNWKRAVNACHDGDRCLTRRGESEKSVDREAFAALLDRIAMRAAKEGSVAGFDGRLIYVRSSGEDSWLCREAPTNPAFDETGDAIASQTRAGEGIETGARANARGGDRTGEPSFRAESREDSSLDRKPTHARSVREALEKARDGDRIVLLRGVHNGCGDSVDVFKRVLITGEGELREATVDARNNAPIFRIYRPCWITNVDFDFTGFSEAVRCESDRTASRNPSKKHPDPLIERCALRCSGSDAVVVASDASPCFRDCVFEARKTGVRVCENASVELVDCKFTHCERQGLRCVDDASATARNCVFSENGHEGVVASGRAVVRLTECAARDNKGPGVDVSGAARVYMDRCSVRANVGGVWVWDEGVLEMAGTLVEGGKSHAVLVDEFGTASASEGTKIEGVVHAADAIRKRIVPGTDQTCAILHPAVPTDLPPETGCFKFEHDPYTRRQ